MDIIVDTDILSTFAKIKKYDLLLRLFRHSKLFIAPRVYQDIITAKELGYDFIEHLLLQMPQICPLNQKEIEEANLLKQKEKTLGWGEIESIVLAKTRGFLLLSNDKKALRFQAVITWIPAQKTAGMTIPVLSGVSS